MDDKQLAKEIGKSLQKRRIDPDYSLQYGGDRLGISKPAVFIYKIGDNNIPSFRLLELLIVLKWTIDDFMKKIPSK